MPKTDKVYIYNKGFKFSQEDIDNFQSAAERLHKQGVPGLLNANGIVQQSALIRTLLKGVVSGEVVLATSPKK